MIQSFTAGKLQVEIWENRQALGLAAAEDAAACFQKIIEEKGECHAIFAAAPSQNEFLAALAADSRIDWSKVHAYHMDEYIGLDPKAPQGFGNFLRRAIFEKVPFASVSYLDGCAENVEAEAARYETLLKKCPPDIVLMGIGENGHIAFNDPHVAHFDDVALVKRVMLDERCRQQQVNDGCFANIDEVPTHALTLTIPALMQGRYVFCMVPAATKAEAVGKTVKGEIRETVPATILRLHSQAILYVDQDSGKELLS